MKILQRILQQKIKDHSIVDYKDLDRKSYMCGYSNGFVQGFYTLNKWIVLTLVISLIFNFISFI